MKRYSYDIKIRELSPLITKTIFHMKDLCSTPGSTIDPEHLEKTVLSEMWTKFGNQSGSEADKAVLKIETDDEVPQSKQEAYTKRIIRNTGYDLLKKDHSWTKGEEGKKVLAFQISSLESEISENASLSDIISSADYSPIENISYDEYNCLQQVADGLFFEIISTDPNIDDVIGLTDEGLIKFSLYQGCLDYSKTGCDSLSDISDHNKKRWLKAGYSRDGWCQWQDGLPLLQDGLLEATGHHKKMIKDELTKCMSATTSRETLRRSLNHSQAAAHLMMLNVWLSFAPMDGYLADFQEIATQFFEEAFKSYSKKRNAKFNCVGRFESYLQMIETNSPMPRRTLRRLLAEVVYDQAYQTLSRTKQRNIQRLIRCCSIIAEDLRPIIETAPLTY